MIYLNNREKSVESEKNSRKYAKKSESDPFCPPDPLCPPPPYTSYQMDIFINLIHAN